MGDWIAFWDSEHPIYVNARHRDVHYRTIAQDVRAHLPAGATVLDYGCGEALHADVIAASATALILCEAAPKVRAALARRFADHANIRVCAPEDIAAMPARSLDAVVLHSVAQYLAPETLDALLATFRRLLRESGVLIVGDVVPPHVSVFTDAAALLRFGVANGFLVATLVGFARTLFSNYWRLRSQFGLTRYDEAALAAKLAGSGFSARRASANIGHNPRRMTFIARPV